MANGLLCNWGIIRGNWQVVVDNSGKNQFTFRTLWIYLLYILAYQPLENIPSEHSVRIDAKLRQGLPPSPDSVESYVLNRACC